MSGLVVQYPVRPREPNWALSPAYAELMVTGNFSFLRGGSHGEELITRAVALGLTGMGLADRNSFAGVVKPYVALKELLESEDLKAQAEQFKYVVGTRLCFSDGTPDIIAYPIDRDAFGRLCRLLTIGNRRAEKGDCTLYFDDLLSLVPPHRVLTTHGPDELGGNGDDTRMTSWGDERFTDGQLMIVHVDETRWDVGEETLCRLAAAARDRVWLAAACTYNGRDRARLNRLADLARRVGVPMIAVNDVLYHEPGRRVLQDVVTCIREHLTIATAGRRLEKNAERHIKDPQEMVRLFREHPDAIAETQRLISRIEFKLSDLKYNYPAETVGNGETAQETLERLAWEGARKRYSNRQKWKKGIPFLVKRGLLKELKLIKQKGYAPYFLTVHDIVRYARYERKILCQGRGSAANSMVCYCLEVTEVEPTVGNLVFGRFLSTERHEPPDIDVDFEHERREEVMQYLYGKYTRERCGLTATVVTYRSKGALREVAKVFGLSADVIEAMNGLSWGWYSTSIKPERVKELGFDPTEPTMMKTLAIASELMGFPRHLSQHVGGFVITRDQLDFLVPISNAAMDERTVIEWDKNDIDALEILKVDVLALGMLTCIRRAFDLMHVHYGMDLTLPGILDEERLDKEKPWELKDSARVYKMTHRADTLGVFQIESRAQMSMLPRLKPKEFYDLVIEVAIVRPGPIQGGMVHPYLKRRLGLEPTVSHGPKLDAVLARTFGVPLFQEQAMQIAVVGAGFSESEADKLRRAMATWKHNGRIHVFKERFMQGMLERGYDKDFAERCFAQIEGFGEYGFPESHAASFALLVYVSCWLKCHYPDVFACALLNSQPMGFYAPSQLVRDAAEHGVEIRPPDINCSTYDSSLEEGGWDAGAHIWKRHNEMREQIWTTRALRLGLRQVEGLAEKDAARIVQLRRDGYTSIRDLWLRTGAPVASLEKLARADAFASLGLNRREALWAVKGLVGTYGAETLPLFAALPAYHSPQEEPAGLPLMAPGEEVIHDYSTLSLSLNGHPVQFLRPMLMARGTTRADNLVHVANDIVVEVAGLVLVRQRPGTASGVIFATLEDETGVANVVVWPKLFEDERLRKVLLSSRMLAVRGKVQSEQGVVHVIAQDMEDLTPQLLDLSHGKDFGDRIVARADEGKSGPPGSQSRDRQAIRQEDMARRRAYSAMPKGRNFH
jgi:DNA-directed DNA polymerase III PolC